MCFLSFIEFSKSLRSKSDNHVFLSSMDWLYLKSPDLDVLDRRCGFKHIENVPFHIWDVILPIDELHHV
jgi:hypothetical protein